MYHLCPPFCKLLVPVARYVLRWGNCRREGHQQDQVGTVSFRLTTKSVVDSVDDDCGPAEDGRESG